MKQKIYRFEVVLFIPCLSLKFISPAHAQNILFNFDNAPLHSNLSLTLTESNVTAHFSATGSGYSIQTADVLGFTPPGFSGYVIYPNSINLADLLIKFGQSLNDFSIMYACQELGCDDAATMQVLAYMNGSLIGTHFRTAQNPGTWPVDTIRITLPQGFDSIVIHYFSRPPTCQDYGTIFMADNMLVTPLNPLSVTLLYFNGEAKEGNAILKWKSADESDLDGYIIQYSKDGSTFCDLIKINAEGSDHDYTYTHREVNGIIYYRLKMLNRDGSFKYSAVRKLAFKTKADLIIVPNPSHDHIQVHGNNYLKTIQILSVDGVILKTITNYSFGQQINISDLPASLYILRAFPKDDTPVAKTFMKM